MSADNETIVVHPEIADADVISHLVVDHVLPRVLARRGYTVLHATCVAYGDRAVAFVGASGAGKSTLAMSAVQSGARCSRTIAWCSTIPAANFDVLASYAGSRLWSDSASALAVDPIRRIRQRHRQSRVRLDAALESGARARLAAVFVLERGADRLSVEAMGSRRSVLATRRERLRLRRTPTRLRRSRLARRHDAGLPPALSDLVCIATRGARSHQPIDRKILRR